MNFKMFFAGMAAVLCWIIISKYFLLIYYWVALMALVTVLTTNAEYKKYSFIANTYFLLYICFISWIRTRNFSFSGNIELWLNNCEHFLFAITVCLLASLYLRIFISKRLPFFKTLLFTIIIFNASGILNEYFQNLYAHRSLINFTEDSKKDLLMNLAGTALFIPLAICWHFYKSRWFKNSLSR